MAGIVMLLPVVVIVCLLECPLKKDQATGNTVPCHELFPSCRDPDRRREKERERYAENLCTMLESVPF